VAEGLVEYDRAGSLKTLSELTPPAMGMRSRWSQLRADQIVQPRAFAAKDENAVAAEVELVVVGCAAFVESNDPEIPALQFFQSADEV